MQKRLPDWMRVKKPTPGSLNRMEKLIKNKSLHTVCHEANCPNRSECFDKGSVTFMILGKNCTRNCKFCNVTHQDAMAVDNDEPQNIADAVADLNIRHIVITSVTRDDLEDGGASQFAAVIKAIRALKQNISVEVLIPDFKGSKSALDIVIEAKPNVIGHNVETVPSRYEAVRPDAEYKQSLDVLKYVKEKDSNIFTKSSLMVGIGEKYEEVLQVMTDLRDSNCDMLTIGQYLQPSAAHMEVCNYVEPETFSKYEEKAKELGFKSATCGPFVRSSYNAADVLEQMQQ